MITNSQISNIGKLVKPHGVNGEIVVTIDCDIDLSTVKCIIINIDGINIPFFISSIRPRGKESYLIMIDGINNETDAAMICGKSLHVLNNEIEDVEDEEGGFYANDLIGYNVYLSDYNSLIGEIIDIEDSTENALFIVKRENNEIIYIPIVVDFIENISTETSTIIMDLPIGLLELN
jgi:16S rRNA processing protein RimM